MHFIKNIILFKIVCQPTVTGTLFLYTYIKESLESN